MSAPDRIYVAFNQAGCPLGVRVGGFGQGVTPYLHADGPTITAYSEALRARGVDPDSIAREAEKEAQNG